ncbi:ATP-binding protein [Leptolyngbya sp. AN02str]|uniref:ATP-binding protein n=1 Tax=Leptolyngbya sp. AN02str TaxID=3423363 RepID=UPI003D31ABC1
MSRLRFLILEDNPSDAEVVSTTLSNGEIEHELMRVETRNEFIHALEHDSFDLILADYFLPGLDGMSALDIANDRCPDLPFILVSESLSEELAIAALKMGATDYVLKHELGRLVPSVHRALREAQEHRDCKKAEAALAAELRDVKRLQHISTQLIQEGDMNALYQQILDAAIALMGADSASFQRLDPNRYELYLMLSRGVDAELESVGKWIETNSASPFSVALNTGRRVIVPDIDQCESMQGTDTCRVLQHAHIRAVQITPLISRSGQLVGMLSTYWHQPHCPSERELDLFDVLARQAADLIEQRQIELDLQASQNRLRKAIAVETVGIIFFDLNGNITEVNDAFLQTSGYTAAEFESERLLWADLIHPRYVPGALKALEELKTQGRTSPLEKEMIRKDGSCWWGLGALNVLNDNEVVEFVIDVSDRKQVERARSRWSQELDHLNQRLEAVTGDLRQRNQDLNQFAYVVSHDLKAPLRGARNLTQWIQEDLGQIIPPDNQELLHLLVKQVDRMDTLISDLLAYSRAGRTQQQPEWVNVEAVVQNLLDEWSIPPGVEIQFSASTPILKARPLNLEQVLSSLLSNALQYGCNHQQGHITISVRPCADWYEFAIADDGPGIEPEYHEKIFGVFETLQPKSETGNTGIGLAIAKKLVEAEGGSIWVDSQPNIGATFFFTWPKVPIEEM